MVLGLLNQEQVFWRLYLTELLGLLTGLGLLELQDLMHSRLLTGFGMLVFFSNWSFEGISGQVFGLFPLFSVIEGFGWFWMGSLPRNTLLMLEFLKVPFLVLHFYYTLMTFMMVLKIFSLINFFCHLISQILIYFYVKIATPPEKSHPPLSQQPPLKVEVSAFLTHVGICRMPTCLSAWKVKSF